MEPQRTDGTMDAIGLVGLGAIGGAIASHLLAAGFDVADMDVRDDAAATLGARAGPVPAMVLGVLSAGAGGSRMLEVRGPAMVAADHTNAGIRADRFLKDVQVIGDFARSLRCPVPLFELAGSAHVAAVAQGHGHHDTSSMHAVAMRAAGMAAAGTSATGEDRDR